MIQLHFQSQLNQKSTSVKTKITGFFGFLNKFSLFLKFPRKMEFLETNEMCSPGFKVCQRIFSDRSQLKTIYCIRSYSGSSYRLAQNVSPIATISAIT